jgi:ATP-dependent RNA helicase SUPV3L1/SUV3
VAPGAPQTTGDSIAPAAAADSLQPTEQPGAASDQRQERHQHHRRRQRPDQRFERPQRERDRPSGKPPRFERREREKVADPNSPFAKLAALKAQLEADAKEHS